MSHECAPEDVAMKTFFLGPQAENRDWVQQEINFILTEWFKNRVSYSPEDGFAISCQDQKLIEYRNRQNQVHFYLSELIERFQRELPKFTPRYIAHMFSETSLPALFGHILTLLHNPNNVSGEASRVGIQIEKESYKDLSRMLGYSSTNSMGHFTSGGTVANFEALVRAKSRLTEWISLIAFCKDNFNNDKINLNNEPYKSEFINLENFSSLWQASLLGWDNYDKIKNHPQFNTREYELWKVKNLNNNYEAMTKISEVFGQKYRGPVLLLPSSCHYSWPKAVKYFGDGDDRIVWIETDSKGRTCIEALKQKLSDLQKKDIPAWAMISIAGTTELGVIDPIDQIQNCLPRNMWHHVDAAYGGFLCSLVRPKFVDHFSNLKPLLAIAEATSVTVDPHKLGYVPYASGVIAVQSKRDYNYLKIDAPYIHFNPNEDVGLQTLEGSRSAAGAVATWLTEKTIGLHSEGYGKILGRTIIAAQSLAETLQKSNTVVKLQVSPTIDTNVIVFTVSKNNLKLSESNLLVQKIYHHLDPQTSHPPFLVSKTSLQVNKHKKFIESWVKNWNGEIDTEKMDLIRLCLMNPFFDSKETNINYQQEFINTLQSILSL